MKTYVYKQTICQKIHRFVNYLKNDSLKSVNVNKTALLVLLWRGSLKSRSSSLTIFETRLKIESGVSRIGS